MKHEIRAGQQHLAEVGPDRDRFGQGTATSKSSFRTRFTNCSLPTCSPSRSRTDLPRRRGRDHPARRRRQAVDERPSTPPQFHPYLPLLKRALDIASPARIGVYDCLYVALAEREGCELLTADDRLVNALPPLKVVQLLGNACLSPITLAPKGPFRPRGPQWILWFSLDAVEPHRVNSNDLVGALGAGAVGRPAAWWRTSHDVLARLMFSSRADSFSPANRLHPHYQRANSIVPGAGSLSRIVYNNHHSFTYAASVA